MPAMPRRTSASSAIGRTSRMALSANAFASSIRPAACSDMAARTTSGPRRGCRSGASSSARRLRSALAPGSVVASVSAAARSVVIATSSPGAALAASWIATSTGNAPLASITSAACRSRARRVDGAHARRTASRTRSCWKLSWSPRSSTMPTSISCSTDVSSDAGGDAEHLRELGDRERTPERSGHGGDLTRRSGHPGQALSHARADSVRKSVISQRRAPGVDADECSCRRPSSSSTSRNGLPPASLASPAGSHRARPASRRSPSAPRRGARAARAPAASAPSSVSHSTALRSCSGTLVGTHREHPSDRNRGQTGGSARNAATVPLSAHCTSSRNIEEWTIHRGALEQRLQALEPPVALLGAAWRLLSPADQATVRSVEERPEQRRELGHRLRGLSRADPDRKGQARAILTPSPIRRLFPIPASPSISSTAPEPERTRSSRSPNAVSSASRPRIVGLNADRSATGKPSSLWTSESSRTGRRTPAFARRHAACDRSKKHHSCVRGARRVRR